VAGGGGWGGGGGGGGGWVVNGLEIEPKEEGSRPYFYCSLLFPKRVVSL